MSKMPEEELRIALARLEERFDASEERTKQQVASMQDRIIDRLDRNDKHTNTRLETIEKKVSEFDKLAIQGRLAMAILVAIGAFIGWVFDKAARFWGN